MERLATRSCLCLLGILALVSSSCQLRERGQAARPGDDQPAAASEPASDKRIVAVAPVALGPLAAVFPEARMVFANDLADRIDWKVDDADGQARDELPDSDAQEWSTGPVPAAAGASLVVLTRVVDITRDPPVGPHERSGAVTAVVEMKAIDPSDPVGPPVFFKRAKGHASGEQSAKLMGDQAKPESVAVWDACGTLAGALTKLLSEQPVTAVDSADRWIVVDIDSDPSRADILVDGAYSGTTPMKLQLPRKKVTVRIERQGYQPWERQLIPSRDMRIQPVLNRLSDSGEAPGAPALRPATAPDATAPVGQAPVAPEDGDPAPKRASPEDALAPPVPSELAVPPGK